MLRWIVSTTLITVIAAVVITWQAKRCETAREECQAATAAHPLTNSMLPVPVRPDRNGNQEQAQNQASGACAHANTYLCRILTPANLPTIYLVLIGLGGIIVAIGTLRILEEQTNATKEAAVAAKLNAEVAINSGRPWIGITIEPINTLDYTLRVTNYGKAPAELISEHGKQILTTNPMAFPVPPIYDSPLTRRKALLMPGQSFDTFTMVPETFLQITGEWQAVRDAQKFLCYFGSTTYRDAGDRNSSLIYETRWCFNFDVFIKEIRITGPDEYNGHT